MAAPGASSSAIRRNLLRFAAIRRDPGSPLGPRYASRLSQGAEVLVSEASNPPHRRPAGPGASARKGASDSSQSTLPFTAGASRQPESAETLAGVVERVTFHSEDSGFCVLQVKSEGRRDLMTVVGHLPRVAAGEHLQAKGHWGNDQRYGPQFRADELAVSAPSTREGIERYLGSGLIAGIGPTLAARLVEAFGEEVFEVIDRTPARLREVPGVGAMRAEKIAAGWGEQRSVREIMVFLHSHGVGTARALRIHQHYGEGAIDQIRADPYRLARDIRGVGFATADALARRLGIDVHAPSRVRAGVRHVLGEAVGEGHCGLPLPEITAAALTLLAVETSEIEAAIEAECRAGELVRDEVDGQTCLFLAGLYAMEKSAAERLRQLAVGAPPWPAMDGDKAVDWVEQKLGLTLAPSQRRAVKRALSSKVLILTGGPGVGKTTLVNALLTILRAKKVRTLLAAPTGRAAKRLSEATGLEASTLHRLLGANPMGGFKRDETRPLDCDLLVVDETSMVDVSLLCALLRALPRTSALLLIGDVDQLPSVGPGQVLADAIDSGALPVVRLREVFRQGVESDIVRNAHRINSGELPELAPEGDSDFFFVEASSPEQVLERLMFVVRKRIPARFQLDPVRDVQVMAPMHRGLVGARNLNLELQRALNPASRSGGTLQRFETTYAVGDKVMQVENDYEKDVYNGDVGFVRSIDLESHVLVSEFDGRAVEYRFEELDRLVLAYAITVHKSQGSEYPAVVIPITTGHYAMLKRNLLYTAVTRGKQLVVLIGQRRALEICLSDERQPRRWSRLRDWLKG